MARKRLTRITQLVGLLLGCSLLTACGNKGPVRPLAVPVPNQLQAPELRQQGDALLLGWQLPTQNQAGAPLAAAPVVDIYRMSYDPADTCPECFDRTTLLVSINPQLPAPAQQVGQRYLYHDRPLQPGTGYQYKLIVRDQDNAQSPPLLLRQVYHQPLAAPRQFNVEPRDRAVVLQWQAPPLGEKDELLGYLIYRSRVDGASNLYPLRAEPIQATRFEDFGLDNTVEYRYQVRALVKRGEQQLEGLAAELVATPRTGF